MQLKLYEYLVFFLLFFFLSCGEKKNGSKISYRKNGQIEAISRYKDGKLNGQSVWFHENGNIEQVVTFKDGVAEGEAVYFYKSGALKSRRHWNNSKLNGFVTDYADDTIGIINTVVLFENGEVKDIRRKK